MVLKYQNLERKGSENELLNVFYPVKGIQKFHSRFPFFPDFDISIPFNAHLLTGIGLRGTGVSFALTLVLAIIT